jgi:hypothetical protein
MLALKIYLGGILVLIGAILINLMAGLFGWTTWYGFLKLVGETGFAEALRTLSGIQLVFLFGLYPLGLGLIAFAALRILRLV